jgi:hypothetical protein
MLLDGKIVLLHIKPDSGRFGWVAGLIFKNLQVVVVDFMGA